MLMQKIRYWVTGWIATVILVLIIITFAVWGINFADQGTEPIVAKVNGQNIKLRQFQQAYGDLLRREQELVGSPLPPDGEQLLKQRTLNTLIEAELLNQGARDIGLRVSDARVRDAIKNIDVFSGEQGFNNRLYEQSIRQMGITPALFEAQLRLDLMTGQLRQAISDSIFVPAKEATWLTRLEKQTRDFSYLILPVDEVQDSMVIEDDAIERYYHETDTDLSAPEQIKVQFIALSAEELAKEIEIDEEKLQDFYVSNKDKYEVKEQRKINIVDFKFAPDSSEEMLDNAHKKAKQIRDLIVEGTSFSEIAEKHNDGSPPEMLVNEYGFLEQGVLPAEVDAIAFSMDEGDISEVIKSDEGLHVLKLMEIKGSIENTLENAREDVELDYKEAEAELKYYDLADQAVNLAYEHPDTLAVVEEEIGIEIRQSEFFSRYDGEGILAHPKVIAASFSEEALQNRQNSEAIMLDHNHLVILRVLEHTPKKKRTLEEVREQIKLTLKSIRASDSQRKKAQAILAELQQGKDLGQVAEQWQFTWQQADQVTRDDTAVNRQILRAAFKLPKPENDAYTFSSTALGIGDYAVIALAKIEYPQELDDEDIEQSKARLRQRKLSADWLAVVSGLRKDADITINSSGL